MFLVFTFFFRLTLPAFLYQSKTDFLLEKEKAIHQDIADERKKYVANRNMNKIKSDRIMPVTNVVTHIRKSDAIRGHNIVDSNDIAIQGSMLSCQKYSVNKQTCPINVDRERKEEISRHLSNHTPSISKICQCCGIVLPSKLENHIEKVFNVCKPQCFPAYTNLDCYFKAYKYPPVEKTHTISQCNSTKTKTGYDLKYSRNECREIDVEEEVMIDKEQSDGEMIDKEQNNGEIFEDKEYYVTIDCTGRKNYSVKEYFFDNQDEVQRAKDTNNEQKDENNIDWKDEARNALLQIGANIKIVNGIEKEYNEIRSEQLGRWSLRRWKQYTENNKSKREKLGKLKSQRKMSLMRSYFQKWKTQSDMKTKEKAVNAEKIDLFLNVLRSKQLELKREEKTKENLKPKMSRNIESKNEFRNRLKIQKDIILSQKRKLAQAEEEMREMKLKNILTQSKASRDAVVQNVKETIRHIDPKLKVAANQIINLRHEYKTKLSDEKAKKLVESMEQRARERKEICQQIQERKKQKTEAMVKMLQDQEAKRLQEEEEKKRKKIEELKEKRRLDRENAIQRENERRRLESLKIIAENFHKKKLKQRSLRAFRDNLRNSLIKMELAEKYYIYQLKRKFFFEWKFYAEDIIAEKMHLAAHFYDFILKRRVFDSFKEVRKTPIEVIFIFRLIHIL